MEKPKDSNQKRLVNIVKVIDICIKIILKGLDTQISGNVPKLVKRKERNPLSQNPKFMQFKNLV